MTLRLKSRRPVRLRPLNSSVSKRLLKYRAGAVMAPYYTTHGHKSHFLIPSPQPPTSTLGSTNPMSLLSVSPLSQREGRKDSASPGGREEGIKEAIYTVASISITNISMKLPIERRRDPAHHQETHHDDPDDSDGDEDLPTEPHDLVVTIAGERRP